MRTKIRSGTETDSSRESKRSVFDKRSLYRIMHVGSSSEEICKLLRPEIKSTCKRVCEDEGEVSNRRRVLYSGVPEKEKVFKHVEGCYCGQSPVRPFLRLTPHDGCRKQAENRRITLPLHGVKRVPKTQASAKNVQTQTGVDNDLIVGFTERRGEYERSRVTLDLETKPDSAGSEKTIESARFNRAADSIRAREVGGFRKDNYFDTHSIVSLNPSQVPRHKCVHKFRINRRFLPEPVNCDAYGISRCVICHKPLESPAVSPVTIARCPSPKGAKNVKKRYEYDLRRPSVNIGTGKEVITIAVPPEFKEECFDEGWTFKLSKQVTPFDSLALRYQKGVI